MKRRPYGGTTGLDVRIMPSDPDNAVPFIIGNCEHRI